MIPGNNSIDLCDAAVMDALSRYLCEEFKSPVKVTQFQRNDNGYERGTAVTFEPVESKESKESSK